MRPARCWMVIVACWVLAVAASADPAPDSGQGPGDGDAVTTRERAFIHLTNRTMYLYTAADRSGPSPHDVQPAFDLTITAGTTVEWYVESGHHAIQAQDGSFASPVLTPGQSYWRRFDHPGTYPFWNPFHLGDTSKALRGVIRVVGSGGSGVRGQGSANWKIRRSVLGRIRKAGA